MAKGRFYGVPQQLVAERRKRLAAAANPIAKAKERHDMHQWIAEMRAFLVAAKDGEPCREAMERVLQFICPAMKSIEGWDDPQGVGDVLCDAVSIAADVINDNGWKPEALPLIVAGLNEAAQIINQMPADYMARVKDYTDRLLVRATEAA
jgi:hypothetical protein